MTERVRKGSLTLVSWRAVVVIGVLSGAVAARLELGEPGAVLLVLAALVWWFEARPLVPWQRWGWQLQHRFEDWGALPGDRYWNPHRMVEGVVRDVPMPDQVVLVCLSARMAHRLSPREVEQLPVCDVPRVVVDPALPGGAVETRWRETVDLRASAWVRRASATRSTWNGGH